MYVETNLLLTCYAYVDGRGGTGTGTGTKIETLKARFLIIVITILLRPRDIRSRNATGIAFITEAVSQKHLLARLE